MSSTDIASAAANGEEPPLKKPSTEPISIHSLPDDLLQSCLACVSRLYYPTLSLVCKRFRSLLAPPEINQARSFLGRTEGCLFVCLRFPPDSNPRWFTLSRKPDQKEKKKKKKEKEKSSGNLLIPISILNSPPKDWSSVVAVGPNLYASGNAHCDCVIGNVTFSYNASSGEFQWRDMDGKERVWRKLRGLKRIPKFVSYDSVKSVGCGGKMMVLWDKYVPGTGYKEKMIWCAVVARVLRIRLCYCCHSLIKCSF